LKELNLSARHLLVIAQDIIRAWTLIHSRGIALKSRGIALKRILGFDQ
jgi:hypothetical protein